LLTRPQGAQAPQPVPLHVDPAEALGEPREIEDRPEPGGGDEALLVVGEGAGLLALGVDGLHRTGRQRRGVIDAIGRHAGGEDLGEAPHDFGFVFGDQVRVVHVAITRNVTTRSWRIEDARTPLTAVTPRGDREGQSLSTGSSGAAAAVAAGRSAAPEGWRAPASWPPDSCRAAW